MHGVDGGIGAVAFGLWRQAVDEETRQQAAQADDEGKRPGASEARGSETRPFGHGPGRVEGGQEVEEEVRGRLQRLEEGDCTQAGDDADDTAEDHPFAYVRRGGDSLGGVRPQVAQVDLQHGHQRSQLRCQWLSGTSPAA